MPGKASKEERDGKGEEERGGKTAHLSKGGYGGGRKPDIGHPNASATGAYLGPRSGTNSLDEEHARGENKPQEVQMLSCCRGPLPRPTATNTG